MDRDDAIALLNAIFSRGFRPSVNDRFQTIDEFKSHLRLLKESQTTTSQSITSIAARESLLIQAHDRVLQLLAIKKKIPKLHDSLVASIDKSIEGEDFGIFKMSSRDQNLQEHINNSPLRYEWIHTHSPVRSLSVPPHNHLMEIAFCIGIDGDEFKVLCCFSHANPGKFDEPKLITSMPLELDHDLVPIAQEFKAWVARTMESLRTKIVGNLEKASSAR